MMHVEAVCKLIDYNYWAHRQVWDCIAELNEEQFNRPSDYSIGSIHEQVVHVAGADWIWLSRLQGVSPDHLFDPADYPTRDSIRARWDEIESELRAYAAALTDERLMTEVVRYQSVRARQWRETPLWQILHHVVNHGTDHRAQILALLHQVGGRTIEQDLIFYAWQR